jgi:hypothetical protein
MTEANVIKLKGASPLASFADSFMGICEKAEAFDPVTDKGYGNILQLTLLEDKSKRIVRLMSGNLIGGEINGKPIPGIKDIPVEPLSKALKGMIVKYNRDDNPKFKAVQAEDKDEAADDLFTLSKDEAEDKAIDDIFGLGKVK